MPNSLRLFVCLLSITSLVWMVAGCGDDAGVAGAGGEASVLTARQTKRLLLQLPYQYMFRTVATPEGAEAAVAGQVRGRHHTVINFGIELGHGHKAVPVPRAGTIYSYGYPKGGFIWTDDEFIKGPDSRMMPNPQLHTAAQFDEASHMAVAMTDKLCLAATGDHCPP